MHDIYLDYQATTPLDQRVLEKMMPTLTQEFGNASSKSHRYGWEAEKYVEKARGEIASVIAADAADIVFTSGATEANNMAIKGVARFNRSHQKNHLITTAIEHKCVLETFNYLHLRENFDVTILPVSSEGLVNPDDVYKAITTKTILVSIIGVSNEIGVVQPLAEIGKICREKNVYFHSDCAQAFGKIPLDVDQLNVDLLSVSAHKIYGPKGVGCLYVRRRPRVKMEALLHGGGQERGLRSGTLPVSLIVGFGEAAVLAQTYMVADGVRIKTLATLIVDDLLQMEKVYLNGSWQQRWPGCLNFSFAGIEGESIMMYMKDIAISSGSACSSSTLEPSYVIQAIGTDPEMAHSSIRVGLGRFTTAEEVDYLLKSLHRVVPRLRAMSPLWDIIKKREQQKI
jgi:cysteine desulfurase